MDKIHVLLFKVDVVYFLDDYIAEFNGINDDNT